MYLKLGSTCMFTSTIWSRLHIGDQMFAFLCWRRERTPAKDYPCRNVQADPLMSTVSRSPLSFHVPMFSRWMTLM
jgi:hypothetical protein